MQLKLIFSATNMSVISNKLSDQTLSQVSFSVKSEVERYHNSWLLQVFLFVCFLPLYDFIYFGWIESFLRGSHAIEDFPTLSRKQVVKGLISIFLKIRRMMIMESTLEFG